MARAQDRLTMSQLRVDCEAVGVGADPASGETIPDLLSS